MSRVAGAIDFGGTKLMVGLVTETGMVLDRETVHTPKEAGPSAVADEAARLLRLVTARRGLCLADLAAVGSTVPGLADTGSGTLLMAPVLGWRNVPFADMLSDRLGITARIANDVNACALAEQRFGVGRGVPSLLWMTVSTGIGAGLILNGKIFEGASGIAGEVGHLVLEEGGRECGCGHRGCLEALAAGPAIASRARSAGLDVPDATEVSRLARAGNPVALRVLAETSVYLGQAVALCVNLLDLDLVVFGGGVSQSLDLLLPGIMATVRQRVVMPEERALRVEPSSLGYEAALIGAGSLVL